jgi:hypothetical protein
VWYRDIGAAEREAELGWLRESVYGGKGASVEVEEFDARTRYSGREGKRAGEDVIVRDLTKRD